MRQIENFIERNPGYAFCFLLLLAIPCFFVNLGLLPLFADEPTRANVALEMILSGNYSVPTIGGEYYYNKPPVYNWILAFFYLSLGSYSEFVTRLPAIIPMFGFAITIYIAVNHFLKDRRIALVSAIFFMVNGRMLIYDSMLGHIDIFYSWLTFISFMCTFYFYERQQWFWLFLTSYLITAVTFLSKGMPSIVFQGFTILTLLIYTRNFKRFFSWQHILSGLICLTIIGAYFYNYSRFNPNLDGYLSTIWDQSSQRTAGRVGLGKSLLHVLSFPFEHLGHLFPASLLVLFCLHKGFIQGLKRNAFLKYIALIFLANIWVYWLSPETRPRYLLMLYPLLFIIWAHAYYTYRESLPVMNKIFNVVLLVLGILVTLSVPLAFLSDLQGYVAYLPLKIALVFFGCALFTWFIWRFKQHKLIPFIAFLLIVRLGFSWFVLPHRATHDTGNYYKSAAMEMGKMSQNASFYFYQYHPAVLNIPFHDRLIFYIERTRMTKVKFTESDAMPGYYLTFDRDLKNPKAVLLKTYESNLKLFKVE
ncbi:glycosyltransferase family 39 protein [Pedobacter sp. SYSU D00535]|uniref:ArnT family glycosyltransferase n=1 Tax=Pedobacter sp. SYSU D00535 TaxID=2810308 RepID=UPI001A970382|nr:hypothetical protein [Pedobacter sp. SYSU D00535]